MIGPPFVMPWPGHIAKAVMEYSCKLNARLLKVSKAMCCQQKKYHEKLLQTLPEASCTCIYLSFQEQSCVSMYIVPIKSSDGSGQLKLQISHHLSCHFTEHCNLCHKPHLPTNMTARHAKICDAFFCHFTIFEGKSPSQAVENN